MNSHRLSVAVCGVIVAALCAGAPVAQGAAATTSAPVVHESFTPLPCTGKPADRTTLQLEGCAEHRVLALDKQIDKLNATIFSALGTAKGRRDFVSANASWLGFRRYSCLSASDNYSGGSVAGVVYANCLATMDSEHVTGLKVLRKTLSPAG